MEEEINILKEIYFKELKEITLSEDGSTTVTIDIRPATADELSKQFISITMRAECPPGYPDTVPRVELKSPRGLEQDKMAQLLERLQEEAKQLKGDFMLMHLIELVKDTLTQQHLPDSQCSICLESFDTDADLLVTECYHYFHSACLADFFHFRHSEHSREVKETLSNDPHCRQIPHLLVACPVCRQCRISFDSQGRFSSEKLATQVADEGAAEAAVGGDTAAVDSLVQPVSTSIDETSTVRESQLADGVKLVSVVNLPECPHQYRPQQPSCTDEFYASRQQTTACGFFQPEDQASVPPYHQQHADYRTGPRNYQRSFQPRGYQTNCPHKANKRRDYQHITQQNFQNFRQQQQVKDEDSQNAKQQDERQDDRQAKQQDDRQAKQQDDRQAKQQDDRQAKQQDDRQAKQQDSQQAKQQDNRLIKQRGNRQAKQDGQHVKQQDIQQGRQQYDQQGRKHYDQQGRQQYDQQGRKQYDQQGRQQYDQQGRKQYDQQGRQHYDQQGRQQYDQQGRQQYDQQGRQHYDQQAKEQDIQQGRQHYDQQANQSDEQRPLKQHGFEHVRQQHGQSFRIDSDKHADNRVRQFNSMRSYYQQEDHHSYQHAKRSNQRDYRCQHGHRNGHQNYDGRAVVDSSKHGNYQTSDGNKDQQRQQKPNSQRDETQANRHQPTCTPPPGLTAQCRIDEFGGVYSADGKFYTPNVEWTASYGRRLRGEPPGLGSCSGVKRDVGKKQ